MNNKKELTIKIGDLVEFCLDPRYPGLKKKLKSSKLEEKLDISVGIVITEPDDHGYVKIQPAYMPYPSSNQPTDKVEVHIEFCKVVSG